MTTTSASPPARRTRRQPQRSCVACGAQRDKRDLIRLARIVGDGGKARLVVDEQARAGGRGAYLCAEPDCWSRAGEAPALARTLRGALTADERETLHAFAERRFAGENAR